MDRVTKEQRSLNMSLVKAKGNKSTELAVATLFRRNKITGWRRHYNIEGRPDFAFPRQKIAVFVDGCFWHGCPKYNSRPNSNKKFWDEKIERNIKRDKTVNKMLKKKEWAVVRIWEHDIKKNPDKVVWVIKNILQSKKK